MYVYPLCIQSIPGMIGNAANISTFWKHLCTMNYKLESYFQKTLGNTDNAITLNQQKGNSCLFHSAHKATLKKSLGQIVEDWHNSCIHKSKVPPSSFYSPPLSFCS